MTTQFTKLGASVQGAAFKTGIGAGILGAGFKKLFLDPAVEADRFKNILETIEGSSAKAAASFKWIEGFAQKTPYQLADVTGSFVKLRAYGLDPTNGLLKTLGDTASAMGKPLESAIEAIADAVTGENERLKEFGIKARKTGSLIVYEYTANGQTMTKSAQANSRAQIQATLESIWNQKYAGAMDKASKGFEGQLSNMMDSWTSFTRLVMSKGPMEWLTKTLTRINGMIKKLADNGTLERWATQTGKAIVNGFKWVEDIVPKVWSAMKGGYRVLERLGTYVGGTANAVAILAGGFAFGGLIVSIGAATAAVLRFSAVLLLTPLGATIALIGALAIGVYSIYDNWSGIVDWWKGLWDRVYLGVKISWGQITTYISGLGQKIGDGLHKALTSAFAIAWTAVPQWFRDLTGGASAFGTDLANRIARDFGPGPAVFGPPVRAEAARPAPRFYQNPQLTGRVDVKVHIPNAPPGTRATARQSGFTEFQFDTGRAMGHVP